MVPLGQVFDKLSRVVRKISRDAGKEIRLSITGADTELDKLIVEELSDPLMHVMRNCIDHGIESAGRAARRAASPSAGTIAHLAPSSAATTSSSRSRTTAPGSTSRSWCERAIERGLLGATEARDAEPRARCTTSCSCPASRPRTRADRDVAAAASAWTWSRPTSRGCRASSTSSRSRGMGTRLTITLPITLAIIQALVIRAAGRTFAVPLNSVLESLRITQNEVRTHRAARGDVAARADAAAGAAREAVPSSSDAIATACRNQQLRGRGRPGAAPHWPARRRAASGRRTSSSSRSGARSTASPGIAGATELGGKKTVLVLDVAADRRRGRRLRAEAA